MLGKKTILNLPKVLKIITIDYIPAICYNFYYWSKRKYLQYKYNWDGDYHTRPQEIIDFDDKYYWDAADRPFYASEKIRDLIFVDIDDLGHEMLELMYKLSVPSVSMKKTIDAINNKYPQGAPEEEKMHYDDYYLPCEVCDKIYDIYKHKAEKLNYTYGKLSPICGYYMSSPTSNKETVEKKLGKPIIYNYNKVTKYADIVLACDEINDYFNNLNGKDITIHISKNLAKILDNKYGWNLNYNPENYAANGEIYNGLNVRIKSHDDNDSPFISYYLDNKRVLIYVK